MTKNLHLYLFVVLALTIGVFTFARGMYVSPRSQTSLAIQESSTSKTATGEHTCTGINPQLFASYVNESFDGPILQNQNNQEFAEFVLHADCKLKLTALQLFNLDASLYQTELTSYSIYKSNNGVLQLLGTSSIAPGGYSVPINFPTALSMAKGETVLLVVKGNLGPMQNIAHNFSQVCLDAGITNNNYMFDGGNNSLAGVMNIFPQPFIGHATCGDRQIIQ